MRHCCIMLSHVEIDQLSQREHVIEMIQEQPLVLQ
jgi:hypothetical protein